MSYNPPNATDAHKIDGFPVPTPGAGEDEKVLTFDNDTSAFKFTTAGGSSVTMGGDVSGSSNSCTVIKIEGKSIPAPVAGDDQKFIQYNHGGLAFQYTAVTSIAVGGDLSGTTGSATVIKIQNKPIPSPGASENLKVIQYNDSSGQFQYATLSAGSSLTVQEQDGSPAVSNVNTIKVSNATLTDNGGGVVSVLTGGNSISTTGFGSEPGSPLTGDLDLYNDGISVARYSGSAWVPWGPIWPLTAPPTVSNWTWVNQGSATATDSKGTIRLSAPATAGDNFRILKRSAPATPYTITALIIPEVHNAAFNNMGIGFRESSSGKIAFISVLNTASGAYSICSRNAASATSSQTVYTDQTGFHNHSPLFLRIADDGANRIVSYSYNGIDFIQLHSVARTDFLTANEVMFFAESLSTAYYCGINLLSWKIT